MCACVCEACPPPQTRSRLTHASRALLSAGRARAARQNFGTVEVDLYRSGHPNELNFPFLERLRLKTVVYLSSEEPSEALYGRRRARRTRRPRTTRPHGTLARGRGARPFAVRDSVNFVDDQGIRWRRLGSDSTHNTWDPLSEDVVVQALSLVLDTSNYPLLIMCNMGRHRTGVFAVASWRWRSGLV